MMDLFITKNNTQVVWEAKSQTLQASRLINSKLLTITTQEPKTIGEFAIRFNNLAGLSSEDFELLSDINEDEILFD